MAAATDRDIVVQLKPSNKQLNEMNTTLTAQLKSVIETKNNLIKKLGSNNDAATKTSTLKKVSYANALTPSTETYDHQAPFDHAKCVCTLDPSGYCWSHGCCVQVGHMSKNCNNGNLGRHKDDATRANTKGGSTKGKNK